MRRSSCTSSTPFAAAPGGKRTEAARLAGMDNRNVPEKMKRHGVTLGAFKTYSPT